MIFASYNNSQKLCVEVHKMMQNVHQLGITLLILPMV